jgi:pantothenate synthetase
MELFVVRVLIFSLFLRGKMGTVCILRKHHGLASSDCAARTSLESQCNSMQLENAALANVMGPFALACDLC